MFDQYTDYDLRPCPHCDGLISERDINGKRLVPSDYALRKACNGCRSKIRNTRGKAIMAAKKKKAKRSFYVKPDAAEQFNRGIKL